MTIAEKLNYEKSTEVAIFCFRSLTDKNKAIQGIFRVGQERKRDTQKRPLPRRTQTFPWRHHLQ